MKKKIKIAVINEVSAMARNPDILAVLEPTGHEIFNLGMDPSKQQSELTYIHTGLMAAIVLNSGTCELVVGGCGTGLGFMMSSMQYPGVFTGLVETPLDAWLFSQINGGNCVSLALNKGYGWAAEINLKYIFERLFQDPFGQGYPLQRQESQRHSRKMLAEISAATHRPFAEALLSLPKPYLREVLEFQSFKEFMGRTEAAQKLYAELEKLP
ncbi:MAG: RpiB/LacA/LacB family sugar-phosphate isomerase [Treponema sp.]|jgi:ribose 5-phosphate isomerase RpiB|nr:RpiB/LacA/LacB family sugar-phosphate isomerase [Treponema sp.]